MAAGSSMLRLTQSFSAFNIHSASWSICQRGISNKALFEKLGLPEKPKKPSTPFFRFMESVRDELRKKNPTLSSSEYARLGSKEWENCDEKLKKKFSEEFKQEYQSYKEDLARYQNSLSQEQKAEIKEAEADIKALKEQRLVKMIKQKREKDLSKPKAPLVPFIKFAQSQEREGKFKDHLQRMSAKWAALSDAARQKYTADYQRERERYLKELDRWEEEMIKQGHVDVVRTKTLKQKIKIYS